MPVTFDNAQGIVGSGTTTQVLTLTLGAQATLLVCVVNNSTTSLSDVLAGGVSMTKINWQVAATNQSMSIWGLTSVAAGNVTISAVSKAINNLSVIAASYRNVRDTDAFAELTFGTAGTAQALNLSISSTSTELVAAFVVFGGSPGPVVNSGTIRMQSIGTANGPMVYLVDTTGAAVVSLSSSTSFAGTWLWETLNLNFSADAAASLPFGLCLTGAGI